MAIRSIEKQTIEEELMHEGKKLLTIKVEYPKLIAEPNSDSIQAINEYYQQSADKLITYGKEVLFPMQLETFEQKKIGNLPYREAELYLTYEKTFQNECLLSFIFDQYEYLGGAHGSTDRYSQTWNTSTGKQLKLENMFVDPGQYKDEVIEMVRTQISDEIRRGEDKYYKECLIDVGHTFKEDRFYLTDKGVGIFFQQYEIAPYASGIPEFILPFNTEIRLPKC